MQAISLRATALAGHQVPDATAVAQATIAQAAATEAVAALATSQAASAQATALAPPAQAKGTMLNVPYKNQNDPDANLKRTDDGAACVAMILGELGQQVTTNAVTAAANQQGDSGLTQPQIVTAAHAFGLEMDWGHDYALDDLKRFIDNGQPLIAMIKYANIPDRVDRSLTGSHYVVVVGYDDATGRVFINDPDYYPGTSGGYQKPYSYQTWLLAWGGFAGGENWNFSLIFPKKAATVPVANTGDVWVSMSDGLNLRQQQNATSQVVAVVPFGTHLTTIGPQVGPDANGWVWQQARTDDNQIGWIVVQIGSDTLVAASKPAPVQVASTVPWGKSLTGVVMANPQPLAPEELNAITDSKVEAVKVRGLVDRDQDKQMIAQLKQINPDMFIIAQLPFNADFSNKTLFSPQDFANFNLVDLTAFYASGVRYFEIGSEPNLAPNGMGWNWASGADFGKWFQQVLGILGPTFPEAKWGYPGLSPQLNVDAFLDGSATAANSADWIGVHCYWQQPAHQPPFPIDGDNAGFYWRAKFRPRFPGKMLMITEFSNNSPAVSPADKGAQYAQYYKTLRNEPNIGAAFSFALSWPGQDSNHEGWAGTAIPTTVGALIGQPGYLP